VTLAPLTWLVAVTFSASYYKIFDPNPRIGFLAHARQLAAAASGSSPAATARLIFNDRLDAAVTAVLIVMIAMILIESAAEWVRILAGRKQPVVRESPFVATRFATEEEA
jgi:carbon starvation protein